MALPGRAHPRRDVAHVRAPDGGRQRPGTYAVQATSCANTVTSAPHILSVTPCTMLPMRLDVDAHAVAGSASNLNGILEPGELAVIEPRYRNTGAALALAGTAAIGGPPGATYALPDPSAAYGTVAPAQLTDCFATTGDCYVASVTTPARPLAHWDASLVETTSGADPARHWTLHLGGTFSDVPVANPFYRFVEAIVQNGVTTGCSGNIYCASAPTTRQQMAVFVLVAREGEGYIPPPCNPASPRFSDVPASGPFCAWIEELARRGVVGGCTATAYCPSGNVPRDQMAVFVLATREAPGYAPPACVAGAERFADVPASSPYCRWIEELARRNVVGGCGAGSYCPVVPVSRGQMGVFLAVTFALQLYGP